MLGSGILYWDRTRSHAPTLDELMPGYSSNRDRQVAILIGTLGSMAVNGLDDLKEPGTQALLIVLVSALVTIVCFRVAWVLDMHEPDKAPSDDYS